MCGGTKETAPPAVVLSPSSRRQASPDRRPKCMPTPDARLPSRFLRSAIFMSPSTRLVGFARESVPSSTLEFSLDSCVVSVSLYAPPTPLPLSPYNCTSPSTLPSNGRVFLWSPRAPLPRWNRPAGRLLSSLWCPYLPPPPPSLIYGHLFWVAYSLKGKLAVCWEGRDNPAPRARARAQGYRGCYPRDRVCLYC